MWTWRTSAFISFTCSSSESNSKDKREDCRDEGHACLLLRLPQPGLILASFHSSTLLQEMLIWQDMQTPMQIPTQMFNTCVNSVQTDILFTFWSPKLLHTNIYIWKKMCLNFASVEPLCSKTAKKMFMLQGYDFNTKCNTATFFHRDWQIYKCLLKLVMKQF